MEHHIADYNGKQVIIDYVIRRPGESLKKWTDREFRAACERVHINMTTGTGQVLTPDGKRYEVAGMYGSTRAKLIKGES